MSSCPICSRTTLRHIKNNRVYWYCPHCHQEVPDLLILSLERQYSQPHPSIESSPVKIAASLR